MPRLASSSRILLAIIVLAFAAAAFAQGRPGRDSCTLNPTDPSVTICSPASGATVTSPVSFEAGVTDASAVMATALYVDNDLIQKVNGKGISATASLAVGRHFVVAQVWDQSGRITKGSEYITVVSATPPGISFVANPASIQAGHSSTLTWSTTNTTSVSIDHGIGAVSASGSRAVSPSVTTIYTLTATGAAGSASTTATVTVPGTTPIPTISFNSYPTSTQSGQSATLSWSTANATSVSINQGIGNEPTTGSAVVAPTATTTYTLSATGPGGSATATYTLTVSPAMPPTINFSASPTSIAPGQTSTLTWSTSNANSVSIDNGLGYQVLSGSLAVSPASSTTYTLTAEGPGGNTTAMATVTVGGSCAAAGTAPSVTICSPANNASVISPVHLLATPNSSTGVTAMAVYFDNQLAYKAQVNHVDTTVTAAPGSHYVVVQFWDNNGAVPAKASINITVSNNNGPLTTSPQSASVNANATQQFTATAGGTNAAVTWYVDGVESGDSSTGTIDATGLYTAPANAGSHQIKAVLQSDPTQYAASTVNVVTVSLSSINHIIFVAQENRSFDTYFGKLNEYRASQGLPTDVDGLPDNCSSTNSDWTVPCGAMNKSPDANGVPTTPIYAFHLKTMCIENTSPDWITSHWDFNAESPSSDTPMMDGFVISAASAALSTGSGDTKGIRAMGFYTGADLQYPYWLASQFATSDRWYSPAPTRTQPNRYYMVGATSGGQAYPSGVAIHQKTIFDLLTDAGVSWKIYSEDGNSSATAYTGFKANGNIVPFSQFITDAQNGALPQVAYIEKPDADEHPGVGDNIQDGVNEVRDLVNAVMYGPSWKDSVMIITFDESGGLYDHVPPPTNVPNPDGIKPLDICTYDGDPGCTLAAKSHGAPPYDPTGDFTRTGFRVPLTVLSPFVKAHYVSHTVTDYTSWMKLVETRFGLPHLNARDAAVSDMTDFFDFQNASWATPPQNPPTVTYGQCYDGLP